MIKITVTEFRKNVDYYLELSQKEDVLITKYGEAYRLLSSNNKHNLRVGASKKEMEGFDISLEELNSIPIEDFYGGK